MSGLGKKVVSLLIVCTLLSSAGRAGLAAGAGGDAISAVESAIGVLWVNTDLVEVTLSFDGGRAVCGALVLGKAGATKITGTAVLSRRDSSGAFSTVKTWSGLEAAGNKLVFNASYYVSTGGIYRLTITATVHKNGVSETVSGYYEAYAA